MSVITRKSDHPRLRGEHVIAGGLGSALFGPPPPARGTRGGRPASAGHVRTTPACAGNTG